VEVNPIDYSAKEYVSDLGYSMDLLNKYCMVRR